MLNITKPTLLLNETICKQNIHTMAEKARKHHLQFRPHFKTHQSAEIAKWFRDEGVEKITVSSVDMALYFAENGWNNITIAFPFNRLEIDQINKLAANIKLNILLVHNDSIRFLADKLEHQVGVFIKIDCGYHRTGIPAENHEEISELCSRLSFQSKLKFRGFLTHAGHSYNASSQKEILEIHTSTLFSMNSLKQKFSHLKPIISIGDTPCCSLADDFTGVDEIRPGNFVFYDVTQYKLSACKSSQIAVGLVCPIVAVYEDRAVIYGGGVHLSKEFLLDKLEGKNFGLVSKPDSTGWSAPIRGARVSSLSQEHGILKLPPTELKDLKPGDLLVILPVHSCMTANLMGEYHLLDGSQIEHLNKS